MWVLPQTFGGLAYDDMGAVGMEGITGWWFHIGCDYCGGFCCVSLVFSEVVWLLQTIITMIASIDDTQYY